MSIGAYPYGLALSTGFNFTTRLCTSVTQTTPIKLSYFCLIGHNAYTPVLREAVLVLKMANNAVKDTLQLPWVRFYGLITPMVDQKHSRQGGSMIKRLFTPTKVIVYMALIIVGLSCWSWWKYIYNSPDRVFWGMVNNSLSTTAFTKSVVQDDGQQKIEQVTSVRTSPMPLANSRTVITQGEPQTARVVTESVGTPVNDYVRYTTLQTSQKGQDGKALDFSKVLYIWGKSTADPSTTNGQLYNEAVLGLIPYGNLNARQRADLIDTMKKSNVYFYNVAKKTKGPMGRTMYVFNVELSPRGYIAALKEFGAAEGLTQFDGIDPAQYQNAQPISVELTVDGWSHLLAETSFGGGSRVEKISGYGSVAALTAAPADKDTIPTDKLRERLSTIQ